MGSIKGQQGWAGCEHADIRAQQCASLAAAQVPECQSHTCKDTEPLTLGAFPKSLPTLSPGSVPSAFLLSLCVSQALNLPSFLPGAHLSGGHSFQQDTYDQQGCTQVSASGTETLAAVVISLVFPESEDTQQVSAHLPRLLW